MKVDSEEQRKLILDMLGTVTIKTNMETIDDDHQQLTALRDAIVNAELDKAKK